MAQRGWPRSGDNTTCTNGASHWHLLPGRIHSLPSVNVSLFTNPIRKCSGGKLLCSASTKDKTQVYESQRSDKTADYCSKNIFLDEASLLENNNQDNGHLLCCVTPLKWFKKGREKKKSCTRCDSASSRLRPTALPIGCRLGTEGRRTQGCIVPP